ncbi:TPM domain-containing protein [Planctopirus hydrillae]|nr:TPM domain-containing protein [Planctopirus hydrillae]
MPKISKSQEVNSRAMRRIHRSLFFTPLLVGLISLTGFSNSARAETSIQDEASFFSPAAKETALSRLKALEAKTGHEVQLQTVATLPEPWKGQLASGQPKQGVFVDFTKDRGQLARAKGLFILVVKDPAHLEVAADRRLRNAGFTTNQRNAVAETLLNGFRAKDYDDGLLATVDLIEKEFSSLRSPSAAPVQGKAPAAAPANTLPAKPAGEGDLGGWGWVLGIGAVVLIVMIGMSLLRALFGGGAGAGAGAGMGGGGGMGFGGSLLTGLFGAMAGHYLYDTFFNNHSHGSAFGNDAASGMDDPNRNDWGSGGDFGDSSGFSGGDFGGGDFGGGGDF